MHKNIYKIMEWAVWANLDERKDVELILLKGHLLLEILMAAILEDNGVKNHNEHSFYKKVGSLSQISNGKSEDLEKIIPYLVKINKLRNKLAHEYLFDIHDCDLEKWSLDVLANFDVIKCSKYTYRTKIVHAFSAIAKALGEFKP